MRATTKNRADVWSTVAKKWQELDPRKRHPAVDAFLSVLPPASRKTAQELRDLVHQQVPEALEAIYWRTPFFCLPDDPLCYLSPTKRHVILGLIDATGIQDDTGLLVGTGKSTIRRAKFAPGEPLPTRGIASWLRQRMRILKAQRRG